MTTRRLAVVSSGLSDPSSTSMLAERLTTAAVRALDHLDVDAEVTTIELRDHAHDLTNNLLTRFASPTLQEAKDAVEGADGLIAVTPVYSGSYTGLFKTFFDVLEPESLAEMPVLIGATAGTPRHALALDHALRPLFTYLRAVVVPTGVFAAAEDWGAGESDGEALATRVERAAGQLATLVAAADRSGRRDPWTSPTPFEDLLRG